MSASYPISDAQSYSLLRCIRDHVTRSFLSLYGHVILTGIIHARDTLDCVVARRTEIHPPPGWRRLLSRTWTQHIGAGTISDIVYRMGPCDIRGHSWRSTLGLLVSKRCDDDLDAQTGQSIATECGITAMWLRSQHRPKERDLRRRYENVRSVCGICRSVPWSF